MVECDYCGEEFDSEQQLQVHWGEEHEDEITSHEKDKVKKARRKKNEQKEQKMNRRKRMAGWGLAAVLAVGFFALVGPQLVSSLTSSSSTANFNLNGQPYLGSDNASVNVVAFEDYRCPHCGNFERTVKPKLVENHVDTGEAKFYFINFPILGSESRTAAIAAECVYKQDEDEFWKYNDALFENQRSLQTDTDSLVSLARENTEGLNYDNLRQCISNEGTAAQVRKDRQMGQSNGVSSTPTVYVNGKLVDDWSYPNLKSVIEAELQ